MHSKSCNAAFLDYLFVCLSIHSSILGVKLRLLVLLFLPSSPLSPSPFFLPSIPSSKFHYVLLWSLFCLFIHSSALLFHPRSYVVFLWSFFRLSIYSSFILFCLPCCVVSCSCLFSVCLSVQASLFPSIWLGFWVSFCCLPLIFRSRRC